MKLNLLRLLIFFLLIQNLFCFGFKKNRDNTLLALAFLVSANQTAGPCLESDESVLFPNAGFIPDFYGAGFPAFATPRVPFTLSPSKPAVIFGVEQKHPFTLDSGTAFPLLFEYDRNFNYFYNRDVLLNATNAVSSLPRGTLGSEYLQPSGSYFNLQGNNTLNLGIYAPMQIPITLKKVTSCSASEEEVNFIPAVTNFFDSGLSTFWQKRKKLKINLIFLAGAYPTTSTQALTPALERMQEVFGQNTVQVDLEFSSSVYLDPEFSLLTEINSEDENLYGSLPSLLVKSASAQNKDALNIFILSQYDTFNIGNGLLGLSSGIPGLPGFVGTKASGMFVVVETHRSSGAVGTSLSTADLRFLGNTMAHEAGHFLGLFHLNESTGGSVSASDRDPLVDTPYCDAIFVNFIPKGDGRDSVVEIDECNGFDFNRSGALNVMFWQGDGITDQSQLTGEQGWLIRRHPLVY